MLNPVMNRRHFLKSLGLSVIALGLFPPLEAFSLLQAQDGFWVNDAHTQLNPTRVRQIITIQEQADALKGILSFTPAEKGIAIAGARHSAGGQQFLTDGILFDNRQFNRILSYDPIQQWITVESGCTWPRIMMFLHQQGSTHSVRQKPTGNDEITIGGSLSTNVHGRGLNFPPIISDVESIQVINCHGLLQTCSRSENPELFSLVIGGYGLFGFIASATIRLYPRLKVKRQVVTMPVSAVATAYQEALAGGCVYGDYEFSMDEKSDGFMRDGFFVTYLPVDLQTPVSAEIPDTELVAYNLTLLVHQDKAKAYAIYKEHHLKTNGQVYWSDNQQLGSYVSGYHHAIDTALNARTPVTEAIMEVFLPPEALTKFFETVRADFIKHETRLIYGTIRFVRRDTESFIPWAKGDFACVIFNLHTPLNSLGKAQTRQAFSRLIQIICEHQGTYYLTYENDASRKQIAKCYPEMKRFLRQKLQHDPAEVFQNNWYRFHKQLLS